MLLSRVTDFNWRLHEDVLNYGPNTFTTNLDNFPFLLTNILFSCLPMSYYLILLIFSLYGQYDKFQSSADLVKRRSIYHNLQWFPIKLDIEFFSNWYLCCFSESYWNFFVWFWQNSKNIYVVDKEFLMILILLE